LFRVNFEFDKKDRTDTWIALISYWELKNDKKFEDTSSEFAKEYRAKIEKRRQSLEKRNQNPDFVQLYPKNRTIETILKMIGEEPFMTFTVKSKKTVSSILEFLGGCFANHLLEKMGKGKIAVYPNVNSNLRWYMEDKEITIVSIFNQLGCPKDFILFYDYEVDYSPSNLSSPKLENVVPSVAPVFPKFLNLPLSLDNYITSPDISSSQVTTSTELISSSPDNIQPIDSIATSPMKYESTDFDIFKNEDMDNNVENNFDENYYFGVLNIYGEQNENIYETQESFFYIQEPFYVMENNNYQNPCLVQHNNYANYNYFYNPKKRKYDTSYCVDDIYESMLTPKKRKKLNSVGRSRI